MRTSGRTAVEQVLGPAPDPADRRLGGEQRAGVGFEEADVGAGGRHRHLDGEDPLPRPGRACTSRTSDDLP